MAFAWRIKRRVLKRIRIVANAGAEDMWVSNDDHNGNAHEARKERQRSYHQSLSFAVASMLLLAIWNASRQLVTGLYCRNATGAWRLPWQGQFRPRVTGTALAVTGNVPPDGVGNTESGYVTMLRWSERPAMNIEIYL